MSEIQQKHRKDTDRNKNNNQNLSTVGLGKRNNEKSALRASLTYASAIKTATKTYNK